MHQNLEKNIQKVYTLKFFAMFLVLMPVVVPFFQLNDIGMKGVYLLQSVFGITTFICEVPSGYISDMLGRKNTLLASSILRGIGFTMFPLATGLNELIVAEVFLGISLSLSSGTDTSILYDTLESIGKPEKQMDVLGKGVAFLSFGEGLASLGASLLMFLSFGIHDLAVISAAMSWIPLFVILTLQEPPRIKMNGAAHLDNLKYIYKGLFRQSKLLNLIILNAVFSFSGTLFAVWMFQKYWANLGIAIGYFGILWAITNFVVSIASASAEKVEKKIGSYAILILIGLFPIAGFFGIAYTDSVFGFLYCLSFQLCRGFGQIVLKNALNKRVTSDFRATANSIAQMGVRIVFTFIGPVVGYLIDEKSLSYASQMMGFVYIGVFVFIMLPLLKERHNFLANN